MKFYTLTVCRTPVGIHKYLLVMKLVFVLIITVFLQNSLAVNAQKVTLAERNISLDQIFIRIKAQTGYDFLYTKEMLRKSHPINVNFSNTPLNEVLNYCFNNQPVVYKISDNLIVVIRRPESQVIAQNLEVKGTITDDKNRPLPGVTVRLKDGNLTSISDAKGNYLIKSPDLKRSLTFSFIGFETQEIPINGRNTINVVLRQKSTDLSDIVVIGYGTVAKSDLTGAVGQVKIEDLNKAPVRSFEEALAGRTAGVQVSSPEGQPGAASNIVIRGNNSITQDNSPLYVIDGFPIENPNNNMINPSEIATISILKDASATAIYGARGANGVIIITTKKGKQGPPIVAYDNYFGIQQNINKMKMMNPYDFVKLQIDLIGPTAQTIYTPGDPSLANPQAGGRTLDYYKTTEGTDWQSQIFRNAAMQNHNLSVRGGTDKTKYSLSGSAFLQDGIIINSGYDRYQGRFNLEQTINDKLRINVNVNYSASKTFGTLPSSSGSMSYGLLYSTWGFRPVTGENESDLADSSLDPNITSDYRYNPVLSAKNEKVMSEDKTMISSGIIDYKITKDLILKVTGGIYSRTLENSTFYNSQTKYGDFRTYPGTNGPNGSIDNFEITNYTNENTLNYNKVFNKIHTVSAVAGYTIQHAKSANHGLTANQLPNESLGLDGLSQGIPLAIRTGSTGNYLESYLARVNYGYKSKYLFTASFRADGSSKFADGHKWGYFPSAAFAWNVMKETFMKKITVISDAKLRTSYGVTGNNRVNDFAYLSRITFPIINNYSFANAFVTGAVPSTLGNTDLRWETTAQFDAGLDISFFKNRISASVDYYNKRTYDLLLNAQLPASSGYTTAFKNIGKVGNSGWEFELNTKNLTGKFSWGSSFNISFNRNKVLALTKDQESLTTAIGWETSYNNLFPYIAQLNAPIAQFFGYKWTGVYQYSDFNKMPNGSYVLKSTVPDNGSGRAVVQPGDIKYADLNNDGTVNTLDRTIIGNPNPKFTGGFSNNFAYKNFDLNVFFQWSYGNDILNANRLVFEGSKSPGLNMFETYADRWTANNPSNTYFRTNGNGPYAYSSRIIEDGSFLRLKTVSLGYSIPSALLKKISLMALRFNVSAQNLITWTNYSGSDPEVSTRNTALTPGFDYSAYPRARTIVFGLNATF
ncbi:TonB-linked outer membrane protein, SusC/RagA family [Pedobacter sp. ok626]|nr:TonB-linked outer membrane protein, SusC/RagA family [Pedobacter sp. ok626]